MDMEIKGRETGVTYGCMGVISLHHIVSLLNACRLMWFKKNSLYIHVHSHGLLTKHRSSTSTPVPICLPKPISFLKPFSGEGSTMAGVFHLPDTDSHLSGPSPDYEPPLFVCSGFLIKGVLPLGCWHVTLGHLTQLLVRA